MAQRKKGISMVRASFPHPFGAGFGVFGFDGSELECLAVGVLGVMVSVAVICFKNNAYVALCNIKF